MLLTAFCLLLRSCFAGVPAAAAGLLDFSDVPAVETASPVASDLVDVIGPAVAGFSAISGVPFTVGVLPLLLLSVLASLLFLASLHAVASVSAVAIGTDVSDVDGVSPMLMPLLSPTFSHTAGILLFFKGLLAFESISYCSW